MDVKEKSPAPKRVKKPNILVRLAALAVTTVLILGALALVVGGVLAWAGAGLFPVSAACCVVAFVAELFFV